MKKLSLKPLTIDKLTLDDRNANKGTKKGRELIAKSVGRLGLGRSIVVDSAGRVIAGNKTLEAARAAGVKNIQLIESDGKTLVVVRRADLDLKKDKKAKELAIADNRTNEVDLSWDNDVLGALKMELDLSDWFGGKGGDKVLEDVADEFGYSVIVKCKGEKHQRQLIDRFKKEGLECKALIS